MLRGGIDRRAYSDTRIPVPRRTTTGRVLSVREGKLVFAGEDLAGLLRHIESTIPGNIESRAEDTVYRARERVVPNPFIDGAARALNMTIKRVGGTYRLTAMPEDISPFADEDGIARIWCPPGVDELWTFTSSYRLRVWDAKTGAFMAERKYSLEFHMLTI